MEKEVIEIPWFYVDDGFSDSKPVMDIPARYRLAACGLWVLAGSWAAKEETDGKVPESKLLQLGATPGLVNALSAGDSPLWQRDDNSLPISRRQLGSVSFKNWQKWQKTRAELDAKRRSDADRQRASRARKLKGRNAVASDDNDVSRCDSRGTGKGAVVAGEITEGDVSRRDSHVTLTRACADPTRPDPTRPVFQLVAKEGGEALVDATGPRPECSEHRENHDGPCRACRRRREWDESHAAQAAAAEVQSVADAKADAARRLAGCNRCDSGGWLLDADGTPHEPAVKCSHD